MTAYPTRRLGRRLRGWTRHGATPAVLAVLLLGVMLVRAQTPPLDVLRYAGYLAVLVTAPGFVVWRSLVGVGRLGDDLATGAATGLAVELFAYQGAAALGHPRWYPVVPLGLLACGVAVPALRRRVFRRGAECWSAGASWLTAAAVVAGCAFLTLRSFADSPLVDGYPLASYRDVSYQLALAAEAKHHFPLTTPYAAGQPLHYQYFVYEHLAAASWASGVDLPLVVTRLFVFPLVALGAVLAVVLARRLGARGPLAGSAAVLAVASRAWPSSSWNVVDVAYLSPTQAYATVLLGALAVVLVAALRGSLPGPRAWALAALLLAASTAGKGTVLPLVIGGLLVVLVVALVRRTNPMPALVALLLAVAAWAVAYAVVFGGTSLGLTVAPLHLLYGNRNVGALGYGVGLLLVLVVVLVSWAAPLLGAVLLTWLDRLEPGTTFVAAMVAGGAVAALLFGQASQSESYFVRTAAILGAAVAAAALQRSRRAGRRWLVVTVVLAVAVAATVGVRAVTAPVDIWASTVAFRSRPSPAGYTYVSPGEVRAARWLRDHAGVGDLVATNEHCVRPVRDRGKGCDRRAFWLAGASERRVLVEGWGYTDAARAYAVSHHGNDRLTGPFPDQRMLRANDAVFRRPTSADVALLRDRYAVRWLFGIRLAPGVRARLAELAAPRYRTGVVVVYDLNG